MDAVIESVSPSESLLTGPETALELDTEMLQQLQQWPMNRKTLEAERDFLRTYAAAFGFGRDQRRLYTLESFLEKEPQN